MVLSGDHEQATRHVQTLLGIDGYKAALTPDGKVAEIKAMQGARTQGLVFVGDGINDAPALATADLGIAMGGGTDVAMQTAPVTLMRADLRLVPAALDITTRTWRRIRWNLFWAFAYNLVGLPLAAMGLLNPALAGAAMALSSVSVVTSSLQLTRWRPTLF